MLSLVRREAIPRFGLDSKGENRVWKDDFSQNLDARIGWVWRGEESMPWRKWGKAAIYTTAEEDKDKRTSSQQCSLS